MSKTSKIVIWVVLAIIVVTAIVLFSATRNTAAPGEQGYYAPTSQNAPAPGSLSTAPTNTSDAALNQDLANIDAGMNSISSDSASIDQGLNDQPVPQGQ